MKRVKPASRVLRADTQLTFYLTLPACLAHPLRTFGNPPTPLAAASGSIIPNLLEQSSNIRNAFLARIREISVEALVGLATGAAV